MLKIRLKRIGRKNHPSFRVVVTESTKGPKSGKVIDTLGFYEPISGKREIESEKAEKWISNGAQPSGTVHNMLVDSGVIKGKKINVLPKKSPVVKEKTEGKTIEETKKDATPAVEDEERGNDETSAEEAKGGSENENNPEVQEQPKSTDEVAEGGGEENDTEKDNE